MSASTKLPVIVAAALLSTGCGSSASDEVKAKVRELARTAAAHNYRRICEDVLAPSLVSRLRSYGISCERAMGIALSGVRDPAISIGSATIKGSSASVITLSMAAGQKASFETIRLIKTSHGWRIASLRSL
jgi:hypothetical protein